MQRIVINLFSLEQDTGHTTHLSTREKHSALCILCDNIDLYAREKDIPPRGKIEMKTRSYYFCSNWNEEDLIIDAIKIL